MAFWEYAPVVITKRLCDSDSGRPATGTSKLTGLRDSDKATFWADNISALVDKALAGM